MVGWFSTISTKKYYSWQTLKSEKLVQPLHGILSKLNWPQSLQHPRHCSKYLNNESRIFTTILNQIIHRVFGGIRLPFWSCETHWNQGNLSMLHCLIAVGHFSMYCCLIRIGGDWNRWCRVCRIWTVNEYVILQAYHSMFALTIWSMHQSIAYRIAVRTVCLLSQFRHSARSNSLNK